MLAKDGLGGTVRISSRFIFLSFSSLSLYLSLSLSLKDESVVAADYAVIGQCNYGCLKLARGIIEGVHPCLTLFVHSDARGVTYR